MAFIGGVATGAAVTMLTAPHSGRETREQLGSYARRGKKKAARLPDAARDAIDSASDAARKAFEGALAEAQIDI